MKRELFILNPERYTNPVLRRGKKIEHKMFLLVKKGRKTNEQNI